MRAYYSENDPHAAAWLRELIREGHIADGDVDERSIVDVQPDDVRGYTQCHFFAGIGGWSVALRLAGWPDDRPVWTGSCPCQPWSDAGDGKGEDDERHLWPDWFRIIRECRPPIVFGEQVSSKKALRWLDGVFADLEGTDYACGAADLCAACVGEEVEARVRRGDSISYERIIVGPPHIRQRLYWVANAGSSSSRRHDESGQRDGAPAMFQARRRREATIESSGCGAVGRLGDTAGQRRRETRPAFADSGTAEMPSGADSTHRLEHAASDGREQRRAESDGRRAAGGCATGGLGDTDGRRCAQSNLSIQAGHPAANSWSDFDLVPCRDGKTRRTQSGLFPLVDGIRFSLGGRRNGRAAILKGAGNAIVPELAAEFIQAYREATE